MIVGPGGPNDAYPSLLRPIPEEERIYRPVMFDADSLPFGPPPDHESTSAELRRVKAELGSALGALVRADRRITELEAELAQLRGEP